MGGSKQKRKAAAARSSDFAESIAHDPYTDGDSTKSVEATRAAPRTPATATSPMLPPRMKRPTTAALLICRGETLKGVVSA
jgi:hypothetical protein